MPKIMKPQIFDSQNFACAGERGADGVGRVGEYLRLFARHRLDYCDCLRRKLGVNVVPHLIAGMLHISHEDPVFFEVVPL